MPWAPGEHLQGFWRTGLKVCVCVCVSVCLGGGRGWKNLLLAGSAYLQVMPEEECLLRGRLPNVRVG